MFLSGVVDVSTPWASSFGVYANLLATQDASIDLARCRCLPRRSSPECSAKQDDTETSVQRKPRTQRSSRYVRAPRLSQLLAKPAASAPRQRHGMPAIRAQHTMFVHHRLPHAGDSL